MLHTAIADPVHREVCGPMIDSVGHLVQAREAAGVSRPGIDAENLLPLFGFHWRAKAPEADGIRPERMLGLVIRCLETR